MGTPGMGGAYGVPGPPFAPGGGVYGVAPPPGAYQAGFVPGAMPFLPPGPQPPQPPGFGAMGPPGHGQFLQPGGPQQPWQQQQGTPAGAGGCYPSAPYGHGGIG